MRRFIDFDATVSFVVVVVLMVWSGPLHGSTSLEILLAGNRAAIYGTLTTLDGALLGFVIATEAITVGMTNSPRLAFVRDADAYGKMWRSFHSAIVWLGLGTLMSFSSLVLDRNSHPIPAIMVTCACTFVIVAGRVARVVWIFAKVIELMVGPSKRRKPVVVPDVSD